MAAGGRRRHCLPYASQDAADAQTESISIGQLRHIYSLSISLLDEVVAAIACSEEGAPCRVMSDVREKRHVFSILKRVGDDVGLQSISFIILPLKYSYSILIFFKYFLYSTII